MTDKVYPSTKPNGAAANPASAAAAPPLPNPPAKTNLYNPNRHPYRPTPLNQKKRRRFSCRRCLCLTCFWSILILLLLLLLAATAAAAFYVLYHPHRPEFALSSLKISAFNLTTTPADDSTRLTTKINITLSAKNPNKKVIYTYDPISISISSHSVILSNASFANFTSSPGSITVIHTTAAMNSQILDADSVNSLNSDLKRKNGLPMEIVMDTMVGVKMEKLKMKKIGIRVKCSGIHGVVPRGKIVKPAAANTSRAKCKVDIKILKLTF